MLIPKTVSITAFQNGDMRTFNLVFSFFKCVCFSATGIVNENCVEPWKK